MGGCGAFGKIASAGDFIRFDMPSEFVRHWDHWLQSGLIRSGSAMGERWRDCYFSAPIWRFTCGADSAGGVAMLGVLMPSVDRVGRQFPLTLGLPLDPAQGVALTHFSARAIFETLEEIALDTLDDLPLEALKLRCADVPSPDLPAGVCECNADVITLDRGTGLDAVLAAQQFPARAPHSLWSARIGNGMHLMRSEGLPGTDRFPALFDLSAAIWQGAA